MYLLFPYIISINNVYKNGCVKYICNKEKSYQNILFQHHPFIAIDKQQGPAVSRYFSLTHQVQRRYFRT